MMPEKETQPGDDVNAARLILDENGGARRVRLWSQIISQVGFPILACVCMFYIVYFGLRENTLALRDLTLRTQQFQEMMLRDHSAMMNALSRAKLLHTDDLRGEK